MKRHFDQRTLAVLVSEAGALPLLLIGYLWPDNVVDDGLKWLMVIGVYTLISIVITVLRRPLTDMWFTILSFGGMLGIAGSAAVIVDAGAAHSVLVLLAAIPALAAVGSPPRTVVLFVVTAATLACAVVADRATGVVPLVLSGGSVIMAITVPTYLVLALRRSLERSLAQQAALSETDPLTGALNRRGLAKRWADVLAHSAVHDGRIGFIEADVDFFKEINDHHGHSAGDSILVDIAETLRTTVRPTALVARTGGEEFVIVDHTNDVSELTRECEKLRAAVEENAGVTVSLGGVCVTFSQRDSGSPGGSSVMLDHLMGIVDRSLYRAKQLGRNQVVVTATRVDDDALSRTTRPESR